MPITEPPLDFIRAGPGTEPLQPAPGVVWSIEDNIDGDVARHAKRRELSLSETVS